MDRQMEQREAVKSQSGEPADRVGVQACPCGDSGDANWRGASNPQGGLSSNISLSLQVTHCELRCLRLLSLPSQAATSGVA